MVGINSYAIRLTKECQNVIDEIRLIYDLNLNIYSGADDYYNYTDFSSPIISSQEESTRIKEFVIEYSKPLYEDKNWNKDKLYSRLLGYGNLGKLTVFSHNVPKSLIPFFWKTGVINGKPWIPLFPERKEFKKLEDNNHKFDIYLFEVAKTLMSDINLIREPDVQFYFETLNGEENDDGKIIFNVPNEKSLQEVFQSLDEPEYQYDKNEFNRFSSFGSFGSFGLITTKVDKIDGKGTLSYENYEKYKSYIDELNSGLKEYEGNFKLYLTELSGQGKLNVHIHNTGIGAANNVRFRLKYNSSELIFENTNTLIAPYKKRYEVKSVEDFEYGNHKFNRDELYEPFYYKQEISGRSLEKNMNLSLSLNFPKISHKDYVQRTLDYLVINRNADFLTLRYELLWDESIEGIEGEEKILLNKIPQSKNELKYLHDKIK